MSNSVQTPPDQTLRHLAARQHGVVARRQLLEAGVGRHIIQQRLAAQRLIQLHPGVYRVGVVAAALERPMAGVLACGAEAVLCHRSATGLWRVQAPAPPKDPVQVKVSGGRRRPGPGVRVYRTRALTAEDMARCQGIPVTSPARTFVDMAGWARPAELREALGQAERAKLITAAELTRCLPRYRGFPGMRLLRALLADAAEAAAPASELERRFLDLMRRARLGPMETNVLVDGWRVDFLWRAARVVVETDGHAYHADRAQREKDYRKNEELSAAGYRVLRLTWRQVTREQEAVVASVARAVATAPFHSGAGAVGGAGGA